MVTLLSMSEPSVTGEPCEGAKKDKANLQDKPHSSCPSTALMSDNNRQVDDFIQSDHFIIADELCSKLGISKGSVLSIFSNLRYFKMCAQRVLEC